MAGFVTIYDQDVRFADEELSAADRRRPAETALVDEFPGETDADLAQSVADYAARVW